MKKYQLYDPQYGPGMLWTGTLDELVADNQDDPIPPEDLTAIRNLDVGETTQVVWFEIRRIQ